MLLVFLCSRHGRQASFYILYSDKRERSEMLEQYDESQAYKKKSKREKEKMTLIMFRSLRRAPLKVPALKIVVPESSCALCAL